MSKSLTAPGESPLDTFRKTMQERVAKEASELMPDSVLRQLCAEALDGIIEKGMQRDDYSRTDGWLRKAIDAQLQARVERMVVEELNDADVLHDLIATALEHKLPGMLVRAVVNPLNNALEMRMQEILTQNRNQF